MHRIRTTATTAALVALGALLAGCTATDEPGAAAGSIAATTAPTPVPSVLASSPVSPPTPLPGAPTPTPLPGGRPAAGSPMPLPPAAGSPAAPPSPVPSVGGAPSASPVPAAAARCGDLRRIPAGASTAPVGSSGGDAKVFLTTTAPWCVGIRTAQGVVALPDPLRTGGTHRLWGVATDGSTGRALVLDDGRTALLFRLRDDDRLQQLQAAAGVPFTFPVGTTATGGRGVACNDQNGGVLIEGSEARHRGDGLVDVRWTNIASVAENGVVQLGEPDVRFAALTATDARVAQAGTSRCWAAPQVARSVHP